jgi:adenine/guanine phosphoribosyltransferase-like PRPP-binding protein
MKLPPFLILFFIKFLVLSQQSSFRDKVNRTVAHSLMFNGIEVVITTVFQAGTIAQNKCVGI